MKNKMIILVLVVGITVLAYFAFLKPKSENGEKIHSQSYSNSSVTEENEVDETWKKYPLDIIPAVQYSTELVEGNKEDLISFSIWPNEKVSGKFIIQGIVKGGYFFEANVLVNVLDAGKKLLRQGNAMATTDWMTAGPVKFEGNLDFTGLPNGPAYIEIHNDNASGLPEHDKSILIPVAIE